MRLERMTPDGLTAEQRTLYELINSGPRGPAHVLADGSLQGPFNAMLHHPVVGTPLQVLGAAIRYEGLLAPRARELAILSVASAHRSEFEWYAHAAIAGDLGVPGEVVEAIRTGRRPLLADPYERDVVDATRAILETGDLDDEAWERGTQILSAAELVELTTLIGYYTTLAIQLRVFRVPLPEGVEPAFSRA